MSVNSKNDVGDEKLRDRAAIRRDKLIEAAAIFLEHNERGKLNSDNALARAGSIIVLPALADRLGGYFPPGSRIPASIELHQPH